MKTSTRFTIVSASAFLCAVGVFVANTGSERVLNDDGVFQLADMRSSDDGYQYASTNSDPKLTFQQLEAIIRKDPTAKQQHGKIEFGSVRMEQGTALAEVMFVSDDGRVLPMLYKLLPQRSSWENRECPTDVVRSPVAPAARSQAQLSRRFTASPWAIGSIAATWNRDSQKRCSIFARPHLPI